MLNLTGHMIIWGGLFAHGDGSTGLMKLPRSAPAALNGRLDMDRSSLGVALRGLPARGRSITYLV
jgi:hypothetical protein